MDTEDKMAKYKKIIVPTGQPNMRPEAYHYYAKEYYDCYLKCWKRRRSYSPVPYTLLFHTVELEIKSFLLKSGKSNSEVKRFYSHDLIMAYNDLDLSDNILTHEEVETLRQATSILNNKEFQYFLPEAIFESQSMPDLKKLDDMAVK